ncbi:hypothetical protein WUBG_05377 [Wuchereria bancrofti]|uniref:Uncharacterized protein n=1 Tax=Wuchereria bancrofti TaxID=6293 RepID=J9EMJ7_WUCBA|nr:hypothetical protein WUBG_05377 [Wuchereria bancrofti]VDM21077.1 unnamed protein product [Wuchereria bancrofti]
MFNGLEGQFKKSGSRYQFNIDRIAEKYCNASNSREMAVEALQRDFGDACISSPVVELKNKNNRTICESLNEDFEMEYGKRMCLGDDVNTRRSVPVSRRKFDMEWGGKFATIGEYLSEVSKRSKIANMVTDSVEEQPYCPRTKRLRGDGFINNGFIDVITSPVKEGAVEIHMNNELTMPTLENNAPSLPSSNEERFTIADNETFLNAWFRNAESHRVSANFTEDHSLRRRAMLNAQRNAHLNHAYMNMSDR